MKIQIDIITGFLDSGKTTFINGMLEDEALSRERIAILQYEAGEIEIDNELIKGKKIFIKKQGKDKPIDSEYINGIIEKHYPDRIIIEYNGMEPLDTLYEVLEEKAVRKKCVRNKIVNIIDANTFEVYMNNIGTIFIEQISLQFSLIVELTKNTPTKI